MVDAGTPPLFEVIASVQTYVSESCGTHPSVNGTTGGFLGDAGNFGRVLEAWLVARCLEFDADMLNADHLNPATA